MKRKLLLTAGVFALAFASTVLADKPKITSQDQLPRFTYEFKGDVSTLLTDDAAYEKLAGPVRADLEKLLNDYDIEDRSTVQGIHGDLLSLDLLDGNYDDALKQIATIRDLEQKPGLKLLTGVLATSYIEARKATEYPDEAAFKAAFKKIYQASLSGCQTSS